LIACATPDRGDVKIIGHGGSGTEGEHPMNSRMALISGLELGLDGIELDVQLTADGVLVAYHAEDLDELTDCTGKVNAFTWDGLRACPNTSGLEPYPIVRLDSALLEAAARFPEADFTLDFVTFAP
jgi:glycerophosphoryl diester phosphodiesterase